MRTLLSLCCKFNYFNDIILLNIYQEKSPEMYKSCKNSGNSNFFLAIVHYNLKKKTKYCSSTFENELLNCLYENYCKKKFYFKISLYRINWTYYNRKCPRLNLRILWSRIRVELLTQDTPVEILQLSIIISHLKNFFFLFVSILNFPNLFILLFFMLCIDQKLKTNYKNGDI
jgi:hypothetical protein